MNHFKMEERDALLAAIGIAILIIFVSSVIISSSINSVNSHTNALGKQYLKALVLYRKIEDKKGSGSIFRGDILLFVQKIEDKKSLKDKILSVSSTGVGNGVRIKIAGINLIQLIGLLKTIDKYENIVVGQFILKKDFSHPDLVDVNLILRKKI